MVSYTSQLKHKNNQKASFNCRKVLDAVCTHVTLSTASRDSAAKFTTNSYQFWVTHQNLRVTFQMYIQFARIVQKYGDAFSKSCSIFSFSYINIKHLGIVLPFSLFTPW